MALRWKWPWIQGNVLKQQRGFFYSTLTQNPLPFTDALSFFFLWPLSPGTRIYQHYLAIILIVTLLMRARIAWVLNFHQCLLSAHVFSYLLCKVNGYLCLCPPEYSGVHCDVKSSGCKGNKCASGSTCVNTPSGHDCVCPIGYEGTFCETKSNVRWWHFPSSYVFVKMLVLICL